MLKFNNPSFEETSNKEWLITNGIGGYASSSIIGTNTRRYHGLLIAAFNPPTQRQVLVSKIEEGISLQRDSCVEFSTNQYPKTIHPTGYQYLKKFERAPLPRSIFQIGQQQIAKTTYMLYGSNTTIVEYENIGTGTFKLNLRPLFSNRSYHGLYFEDASYDYYYERYVNVLKIYSKYGATPIYCKFFKGEFKEDRNWFKNFQYSKEEYRGLGFQEDAYALGQISCVLEAGEKITLLFTTEEDKLDTDPEKVKEAELKRIKKLEPKKVKNQFFKDLSIAGDQVIVKRASTDSYTILAGYHWFTDWGRDTMIAMRGLCIAADKKEISQSILNTFFSHISEGMLPNRFPDYDGEDIEYNTIDATLWLFIALYEYYQKFKDDKFISKNFDSLSEIIRWHLKGTRYDIHLTSEGFIYGGKGISQLTWMDARVGDYVVTPRHGCPVEIQALWYNALEIYSFFSKELSIPLAEDLEKNVPSIISKIKTNFSFRFLNDKGYLNDVVNGDEIDDDLRPNQIYVLSLPFSLLLPAVEKRIFKRVQEELYTPFGLRTLETTHEDFKPIYKGDQWNRDTAYHQGTVWPFLLGDYFLAQLKVFEYSEKVQKEVHAAVSALEEHFYSEDCIHGFSEIFDGLEPNEGRGTVQQAWSISGLLQTLYKLQELED